MLPFPAHANSVFRRPQISGRGGGTRTRMPGFGDRSPSRWTTPLKANPVLPNRQLREKLLHFLVRGLFAARVAKLPGLQSLGVLLLVLCRCVVAVLTVPALQRDNFPHISIPLPETFCLYRQNYSIISVTAPAPTVCPPSRIANRKPFSRATGVINVTSQLTLSPGITISTPAARCMSPVTSVVRK